MINEDLREEPAVIHRVQAAWLCYHKWGHILESHASLGCRLHFWERTVLPSLLWGLQTTRAQNSKTILNRLRSCQACMVRKMLKIKRFPNEAWLDWHKRSFRRVHELIQEHGISVTTKLEEAKRSWAGHCIRFGLADKPPHLLKAVMFWRPFSWWVHQKWFNSIFPENRVVHAAQQGIPKRWEAQFSTNWPHVLCSA